MPQQSVPQLKPLAGHSVQVSDGLGETGTGSGLGVGLAFLPPPHVQHASFAVFPSVPISPPYVAHQE